ncbi:MAG: hypothetical protein ACNA8W_11910 [Bradymonadaceae bacterium]
MDLIFILAIPGLVGCSHYGWADRPVDGEDERTTNSPVAVSTLVAEAHQGLDVSSLTGHFLEMLRREGLTTAEWGGPRNGEEGATVEVACQVEDAGVMGFGVHLTATSAVTCILRRDDGVFDRISARGTASRAHPEGAASSLLGAHRQLEEDAVLDALSRISPEIAHQTATARKTTRMRPDE